MDTSERLYHKILHWMSAELANNADQYIPDNWHDICATTLAESAIEAFDCWHDETHIVWDCAVDAIEQYERLYN